jgi:hypothetical protein
MSARCAFLEGALFVRDRYIFFRYRRVPEDRLVEPVTRPREDPASARERMDFLRPSPLWRHTATNCFPV